MKKFFTLSCLVMCTLLISCSNADSSHQTDDSSTSGSAQIVQYTTTESDLDKEITSTSNVFDRTDPDLDPRLFTVTNLSQLQTIGELTLVLTYETTNDVSSYLNQWIIIEAITPYDFSEERCAIYTNYNNVLYFIDHDEFITALEAPTVDGESGMKVLCYLTEDEPGSYVMKNCIYMGSSATEMDINDSSNSISSDGQDQTLEDYVQSQNNPNDPIDDQIIDGIGDAFHYAAQDPNQSQEDRELTQAFGDAWDFVAALKKAGY